MNQAPIIKLAHITHGLRTGRGRRGVEFQAAALLEEQATQLDLALSHLEKVLKNRCNAHVSMEDRDTILRDAEAFLRECGR